MSLFVTTVLQILHRIRCLFEVYELMMVVLLRFPHMYKLLLGSKAVKVSGQSHFYICMCLGRSKVIEGNFFIEASRRGNGSW